MLFSISTRSIANVGISASRIRRRALAMLKSVSYKTNFIVSVVNSMMEIFGPLEKEDPDDD